VGQQPAWQQQQQQVGQQPAWQQQQQALLAVQPAPKQQWKPPQHHGFLVQPNATPQLPQVPEEPDQQQQQQQPAVPSWRQQQLQQPVAAALPSWRQQQQQQSMSLQPSASSFKPLAAADLLPKPGGSSFTPGGAKPPSDAGFYPKPQPVGTGQSVPWLKPAPAAAAAAGDATAKPVVASSSTGVSALAAASGSAEAAAAATSPAEPTAASSPAAKQQQQLRTLDMAAAVAAADAAVAAAGWEPGLPLPMLEEVEQLLDLLECDGSSELLTVEQLQHGLASLGYALEPSEVLELAKGLGYGVEGLEGVPVSQFAASQLDWEDLQVGFQAIMTCYL
jgi:hypothetical protein